LTCYAERRHGARKTGAVAGAEVGFIIENINMPN